MKSAVKSTQWKARESLRDKGQFWTPAWVAQAMVTYSAQDAEGVYDPGVGRGAFARAAEAVATRQGRNLGFAGSEIDPEVLASIRQEEPSSAWLKKVRREDFLSRHRVPDGYGIVANPPYIRHHRLGAERKAELKALVAREAPGLMLDGRAGLHVYFLLHALAVLPDQQRLAFIVPADLAEGVFARPFWKWVAQHWAIEAVWRFAPEATPFEGVDTNPLVVCLRKAPPQDSYVLATVRQADGETLMAWVEEGLPSMDNEVLSARTVALAPALEEGISRDPCATNEGQAVPLSAFARTVRGIATGANEFFFLTRAQLAARGLPLESFVRAVGRTRDAKGECLTVADLDRLDEEGRATYLLNLDGRHKQALAPTLQVYLDIGEQQGLAKRALIAQRKPWYRMERREAPYWLFAYLGRRDSRFIRNEAEAVPLTGFLCVYPHHHEPEFLEALHRALADPRTLANLHRVGKTYGGGAIKVEPRALERLPIPAAVIEETGLQAWLDKASA